MHCKEPPGRRWEPTGWCGSVLASGRYLGVFLYSSLTRGGSEFAARRIGFARNDRELLGDRPFPANGYETFEFVRPGLVCRWFCGAELCGVLVLPAIRCKPGNTWRHFLLGKYLCGDFRTIGVPSGLALGPHQHDGGYAPPFQRLAHPCATNAQPLAGGFGSSGAL